MGMPKLKRIKVSSDAQLRQWLSQNKDIGQQVMIITCDKTSPDNHISSQEVRAALSDLGWTAGRSYTLPGNLMGHVAAHA